MNRLACGTFLASALVAAGCVGSFGATEASAATAHARIVTGGWSIPDPYATPGAVLTTSAATVCRSGYASSVRNVFTATKN